MATSKVEKVTNDIESGKCKMPDGTLILWGSGTITGTSTTEADYYVTFASAFSASPIVTATMITSSYHRRIHIKGTSVYGFTITAANSVDGQNAPDTWFNWIAVGRWK